MIRESIMIILYRLNESNDKQSGVIPNIVMFKFLVIAI